MHRYDFFKTFLRYMGILIMNLIVINVVLLNNFYTINSIRQSNMEKTINATIIEYNELDMQHLCIISNCTQIGIIGESSFIMRDGILKEVPYKLPNTYFIDNKNLKLTEDLNILGILPDYQMYVVSSTSILIQQVISGCLTINLIFLITYTFVFLFIEFKSRRRKLLDMVSTSNTLREKNMQILTENIHHELNTPVAIIQGNIRKLEIEMSKKDRCNSCRLNFNFDFEQIYASIEQVDTVLQRMSNFKNLKYSNGNKNLMNIIDYSANSMGIYKKSNFEIEIDPELKNYKLIGSLKNGDLLNIVSNHFRNSIEANSTRIITEAKFDEKHGLMHLYIIDNGNGLRDPSTGLLLTKDKYPDIFKPYYSSKDSKGKTIIRESKGAIIDTTIRYLPFHKKRSNEVIRGVGLYLNKELLTEKGGKLKLRETTEKGTVFEIIFFSQKI